MYACEEKVKKCHAVAYRKRYYLKRQKILDVLGNSCKDCGFSDVRALAIDHINGGGKAERAKFGGAYYSMILKKILSGCNDYQVLCFNCNQIKKIEKREGNKRKYSGIEQYGSSPSS